MVSVSEASSIVLSHLYPSQNESIPVAEVWNHVLAEEIIADRDFPPFDRVAMDGIAVQFDRYQSGQRRFKIAGVAAAGDPQRTLDNNNESFEVMTGSSLPRGTDTVIRYEDVTIDAGWAEINLPTMDRSQNIHPCGQDAKRGDVLLAPGFVLSPAEIALMATVGKSTVKVRSRPRAAIISTGNELVDIQDKPLPHQIRRSNVYSLQASLASMKCASDLFHLPDDPQVIHRDLKEIINNYDVIILSGGVSKGKFDHVPAALEQLGVVKHFHRVKQKPGKPFWFGTAGSKALFALPGNPVSTYMCFYRYIQPWLLESMGVASPAKRAILAKDFRFETDLTYFLQVKLENIDGTLWAHPVPGGGSGDLDNLKDVDGFMELPSDQSAFSRGSVFPVFLFRQV